MRLVAALLFSAVALTTGCSGPSRSTAGASPTIALSSQTPTGPPPPSAFPSPSPTAIPLPTTAQFSAPSATVIWGLIADQNLFLSTDQGKTWQRRTLPSFFINPEISFVSQTEGWLSTVGSPETQCNGQPVTIWHTGDGAMTWQKVTETTYGSQPAHGIGYGQCKAGLSFIDSTHGFISGYDPNDPPQEYRTADGGQTWSSSGPLPDPPGFVSSPGGFTLGAGQVHAFGSILLVAAGNFNSTQQGSYVFRSINGGATWRSLVRLPAPPVSPALVTEARWLYLVPPGQATESLDAGNTWHAYASDYEQAAGVAPTVVFADSQVGYSTVRGDLQRTLDGGAHWTVLHTPGT
jgi:photosystem II stability/assembly factor-like uncharacterized protein